MSSIFITASARRGTMLVAALIMITLLTVVVSTIVLGGGRDADLTRLRLQSDRARLASSAAAQMAVKEIMDNVDRDADGAIGTISNDGNTATDPLIGTTRVWATKSVAGSTTTVTARAQADGAAWATNVVINSTAATTAVAGNILFVVPNAASLGAQETARKTLMEGWGYTVTPITATSSQAAFDTAVLTSSCAYICETITSTDLGNKLLNAPIGIVNEEQALSDDYGFSSSATTYDDTQINITNNTHYITSQFSTGNISIWTSSQGSQGIWYPSGTVAGFTTLAQKVGAANPVITLMERATTLTPSGTAKGRRVNLPWGSSVDITKLTANGQTLMRRAIEWCILPVGYWALDDASGTTAIDSIAGRNGALTGPTWTTGKVSGGLNFDGANDYVTITNHAQFQITAAYSVAAWVKATSAWPTGSTVATILRKGDANPNNWQLSIANGGKIEMMIDGNDGTAFNSNTTLTTNVWHHVAGTWDGQKVRLYLDGVLDNTPATQTTAAGTDARDVYLGGRIGSTDITPGVVDEVRFYSRALTAAEVAALANPTGRPKISSWVTIAP